MWVDTMDNWVEFKKQWKMDKKLIKLYNEENLQVDYNILSLNKINILKDKISDIAKWIYSVNFDEYSWMDVYGKLLKIDKILNKINDSISKKWLENNFNVVNEILNIYEEIIKNSFSYDIDWKHNKHKDIFDNYIDELKKIYKLNFKKKKK